MKTKEIFITILFPILGLGEVHAQFMQTKTDSIVLQRMSQETRPHTIFSTRYPKFWTDIITANGEILEIQPFGNCFLYYVDYINETAKNKNHYLIASDINVNNLLEVKTNNDTQPDLKEWRLIKWIDIPFTEYSLESTACQWENFPSDTMLIINSNAELENYITCTDYPAIDFNLYSLLLVRGATDYGTIAEISKSFVQIHANEYKLNIKVCPNDTNTTEKWVLAILIPKLQQNDAVTLNLYYTFVGTWEYNTPQELIAYVTDATITLTFDAEQVFVNTSPQVIGTESYFFTDGSQYFVYKDTMYTLYYGMYIPPIFSITRLSPNSIEFNWISIEIHPPYVKNYSFNRKTE